jgi:tripartite-type tricarboxylate transporter receptor subunit TctC
MRRNDYCEGNVRSVAADRGSQRAGRLRTMRGFAGALVVALLMNTAGPASAADWPTRPITVVVPYAAGGNTDMMARLATRRLAERLGQPFVIENRPGGAGSIGAIGVARAEPNGYTLMFGASTQIINVPSLQKVSYDPDKDFVPVSIFGAGPYLLGIKSSLPAKTLREFVAYAKRNPGLLNYASAGHGGNVHLNTALFLARAGLDIVHVPYKSGAPAMSGLVAGEVEMYFGNASELIQHAASDRVRLLAVSTAQPLRQLPDVPTVAALYPGFDTSSWNGFFAPAGTPQAIIDLLVKEVIDAAKDPQIIERLEQLAIVPLGTTQAEFVEIIERSKISNRDAMKAAGLKGD